MKLQKTADNSYTLFSSVAKQTYHSLEGAIMEAEHVYVNPALTHFPEKSEINILEIGFGTGLNTFLTLIESEKLCKNIYYEAIEAYPVPEDIYSKLNYPELLNYDEKTFLKLHQAKPNEVLVLSQFIFLKKYLKIEDYNPNRLFDIIYFDAFSPDAQPEIWTTDIFTKLHQALVPNGILLTYSAKGVVKQALRLAGFHVKRLPGAGSKHHMIKAIKSAVVL